MNPIASFVQVGIKNQCKTNVIRKCTQCKKFLPLRRLLQSYLQVQQHLSIGLNVRGLIEMLNPRRPACYKNGLLRVHILHGKSMVLVVATVHHQSQIEEYLPWLIKTTTRSSGHCLKGMGRKSGPLALGQHIAKQCDRAKKARAVRQPLMVTISMYWGWLATWFALKSKMVP